MHFHSAAVDPDLINAVEYTHATVDETGSTKNIEILNNIHLRVRNDISQYLHTVYTGVPVGINHYAELFDSDDEDQIELWNFHQNDFHQHKHKELFRYKLNILDNPHLPDGYVESIDETYAHDPALLRAYKHGEFTARAGNLAAPSYLPHIHNCEPEEADRRKPLYFTLDFNYEPVGWVVLQYLPYYAYDETKYKWVALESSSGTYPKLRNAVLEFALKFPVEIFKDTEIRIYGDPSGHNRDKQTGKSDFDYVKRVLKELGYQNVLIIATSNKIGEEQSIEAIDRLFFDNLLFICKNCTKLRWSLLKTEKIPGLRKILKEVGEEHTHWFDALKYWAFQCAYFDKGNKKEKLRGINI